MTLRVGMVTSVLAELKNRFTKKATFSKKERTSLELPEGINLYEDDHFRNQ